MIRVLALDTSTHTGWACDPPAGMDPAPHFGTLDLGGWRPDDVGKSYANLHTFIAASVLLNQITHCVIERPLTTYAHSGFGGTNARKSPDLAQALMGFTAVAECAATMAGCKVHVVSPATVRKHFCGVGNPTDPKRAVMMRCRALGWKPRDDNQGDALACWDYAKSVLDPAWAHRTTALFFNGEQPR